MKKQYLGVLAAFGALAVALGSLAATPSAANAVSTDVSAAKGRATGSGKWGYVGQFGKLNKTTQPALGDMFLPYGIDIHGDKIAVTDSGLASWESGNKSLGHAVQTYDLVAAPGSAGHGDYLGSGQYDIVDTKHGVVDPHELVETKAVDYYASDAPRGPRGVAYGADGVLFASSYEAGPAGSSILQQRKYSSDSLGTIADSWGPSDYRVTGALPGAVATDTDAQGNVFTGTNIGVSVYDANGEFKTSIGTYFDQDGNNQTSRVAWSSRNTDVPREYGKPDLIGETYGLSVTEEDGQTVVYVGDAGAYYQSDYKVHFQGGATARHTKPASIKKYILTQSGGTADARWNPSSWKWTLDTSFGNGGAVQYAQNSLSDFFGRPLFQGQTVFALEADPESGTLYYALNGAAGKKIGALDLETGAELEPTPAPVNSPSALQDSAMGFVRGIAVDGRGLVYATTQHTTSSNTTRAVVQIWGKTPSSIEGTGQVEPGLDKAVLTWDESTVGYQQPDLLDYVVKYREVGATDWTVVPLPAGTATSTELSRTITGLSPDTEYEAVITPFNEAGSGDPATVTWRTESPAPSITVVKQGNGVSAPTSDAAVKVEANSDVAFEYVITNDGNVAVSDVALVDSEIASVEFPADFDGVLEPGASVTAVATGPIAAGEYKNIATVTAIYESTELNETVEWHGFGVTAGLTVVKLGNDKAALTKKNAVNVSADSLVHFEYTITNTGNSDVEDLNLIDDVLGTIDQVVEPSGFSGTLAPGASVTYATTGGIPAGVYVNTAEVSGVVPAINAEVTASTVWHGFGTTKDKPVVPVDPGNQTTPDGPSSPDSPKPAVDGLSATGGVPLLPLGIAAGVIITAGVILLLARKRKNA